MKPGCNDTLWCIAIIQHPASIPVPIFVYISEVYFPYLISFLIINPAAISAVIKICTYSFHCKFLPYSSVHKICLFLKPICNDFIGFYFIRHYLVHSSTKSTAAIALLSAVAIVVSGNSGMSHRCLLNGLHSRYDFINLP